MAMRICISGFAGCGKNTAGAIVARELGLPVVDFTFKGMAAKMGIGLEEMQLKAANDKKFDLQLDEMIVKEASGKECVAVTWLAPWMVKNATLRVWLNCSEKERARRVAGRDKMGAREALMHVKKRDAQNIGRYQKLYGIDIREHGIFDLEISSEKFRPEQVAKIIICAALEKK
jgi:cytidylate kinase